MIDFFVFVSYLFRRTGSGVTARFWDGDGPPPYPFYFLKIPPFISNRRNYGDTCLFTYLNTVTVRQLNWGVAM
jgi:hypothetical protein